MHSASLATKSFAQNQSNGRKLRLTLACCLFALVLIGAAQPLLANPVGPRWAYILDPAGLVHTFAVTRTTGALAPTACVAQPAGVSPVSLKINSSNTFVFVTDNVGNNIFGYVINPVAGCLVPTAQVAIGTMGTNPTALHITADGKFLYVSDVFGGAAAIEGYSITPGTGALVLIPGTPFNYGANQGPLAYDPAGDFLLAAVDAAPAGPILSFNVAAGGALAFAAASPTVMANPTTMTLDAVHGFLFVLSGGPVVDSYALNPVTGALALINAQPTGAGPNRVVATSIGQLAYVTNTGGNSVSSYSIGAAGNLHVLGAPTVLRLPALAPQEATIDANGEFLYTTDQTGDISIFKISAGRAVEVAAAWSPFAPGFFPNAIALTQ
jgi:6-phosphogluconolactonase